MIDCFVDRFLNHLNYGLNLEICWTLNNFFICHFLCVYNTLDAFYKGICNVHRVNFKVT